MLLAGLYECAVEKGGYIFLTFPSARRTEDICVFRQLRAGLSLCDCYYRREQGPELVARPSTCYSFLNGRRNALARYLVPVVVL